jgi:hypothetical protein
MDLPGDWFVVTFLTCAKAGVAVTHSVSTAAQQSVAQTKFIQASLSANIFQRGQYRSGSRLLSGSLAAFSEKEFRMWR